MLLTYIYLWLFISETKSCEKEMYYSEGSCYEQVRYDLIENRTQYQEAQRSIGMKLDFLSLPTVVRPGPSRQKTKGTLMLSNAEC